VEGDAHLRTIDMPRISKKNPMEEKIEKLSTALVKLDEEFNDFRTKANIVQFIGFIPFLLVSLFFQLINYQPVLAWAFTTIWVLKVAMFAWTSRFSTDDKERED
jgi:hypothetical protein